MSKTTYGPKATTVPIPKFCCRDGCKKVARYAEKLGDFWITKCDDHAYAGCELSVTKAVLQYDIQ